MPATDETRKILPIFLIVLIDVLGLMIILPLLPFYSEQFGAPPFVVGMLISSYALCQLVSAPLLGRWLLAPWAWFPASICMLGLWLCVRMPS